MATASQTAPAAPQHAGVSADTMKKLDDVTAKLDADHAAAQAAAEATPPAGAAGAVTAEAGAVAAADAPAAPTTGSAPANEEQTEPTKSPGKTRGTSHKGTGAKAIKETRGHAKAESVTTSPTVTKPEAGKKTGAGAGEGDKDFDALLKEAGVTEKKAKPKLDKKELSGDDFKQGMAAVAAKAQACYKGTQGSANVKLVIAPSGEVSKISIKGVFAGTPEAACVEAAVKSAPFPPWDGGPQTFGYSYAPNSSASPEIRRVT